jgi:preprotein translocase subunit YajC
MIILFVAVALFAFWTWRSGRARKAAMEETRSKFVPGAEVMTTAGIYGTIKSVDGDVINLEIAPKTVIRIHSASVVKLVTADESDAPKSVEEAMARAAAEQEAREAAEAAQGEPEFGERDAPKKPARRPAAKKTAE